ncbi:MAG: sugar nucleotide-binding protein [Marmoricola sp.]
MTTELTLERTPIPGMVVLRLPVLTDARGWFKENWQRAKMTALGLPDFGPVQNNVSFNASRGTTRGIHTEPWDKLVSVVTGRVFAAWVDMRAGTSFGTVFHLELDPGTTVFVPRGVGNSYQTLEDGTVYSYLVNDHWRPGVTYPALQLGDPTVAIPWPIPLSEAEISEKDQHNPLLADATPVPAPKTLIIGNRGQLGRALAEAFPDADGVDIDQLDLTDSDQVASFPWGDYTVLLNAAAYTAVDDAETPEGRVACWAANASAPATLARIASKHRQVLVHYSTDYVFDGSRPIHTEDEPLSPLGVYGQSKAAGDLAVAGAPHHYLLRTSWVVGDGRNFVRTMHALATRGDSPTVVDDQVGRLTFTSELARATRHLLETSAPYGTYNATNAGTSRSWADWAKRVFALSGRSADDVATTTTEAWAEGRVVAPRPRNSEMDLTKLRAAGFAPQDADEALAAYLRTL